MRHLQRLLLVLGSASLTFLSVEVALRALEHLEFGFKYAYGFTRPHPVLAMEHARNFRARYRWPEHPSGYLELRTNNLGLREDHETSARKPTGVCRVLALGDSQTDGLVFNHESWPNLLEQQLNQAGGVGYGRLIDVLNAGVAGYVPLQSYLWWRVYGRSLEPDLVIFGLYLGNDLEDPTIGRLARAADGTWNLDETPHPVVPDPFGRWLLKTCRLCLLLSYPLRGGPLEDVAAAMGLAAPPTDERKRYLRAERTCQGCVLQSLRQVQLLEGRAEQYQAALAATEEVLRRFQDDVEAAGAAFLVLLIPSRRQVEDRVPDVMVRTAGIMGIALKNPSLEDRIEADVLNICARRGIPVLNPRPVLRRSFLETRGRFYFETDWHLTPLGNAVVAQFATAHLRARHVAPRWP